MRIVKTVGLMWIVVVGFALLRLLAFAADTACSEDTKKFCKDVKQGEGRVLKCLGEHEAQLSEGCRKSLASARAQAQARQLAAYKQMQGCKADIQKLCKDVKPGEGHVLKCLHKNEAALSPECKAALEGRAAGKAQKK